MEGKNHLGLKAEPLNAEPCMLMYAGTSTVSSSMYYLAFTSIDISVFTVLP